MNNSTALVLVLMALLLPDAPAPVLTPVDAAPTETAPTESVPTESVPTESVPTESAPITSARSRFFLGLHHFADWTRLRGEKPGESMLLSPVFETPLAWNELVISWNATLPKTAGLVVEARGWVTKNEGEAPAATKFYNLGRWANEQLTRTKPEVPVAENSSFRQSVKEQADADGDVETDTLVLQKSGNKVQIRLTWRAEADKNTELSSVLRFIGLSFLDSTQKVAPRTSNRAAWGKTIAVPERFQNDFRDQGGAVWCSPTSLSMILEHWSREKRRAEMNLTVPEVAGAVHDPQWPGTGNWAFNVAFAGSFPSVRAYVSRLDDLSDLEAWIAAGVPVALSVNYGLLKGQGRASNGGHLVVCNGFTKTGDVVIADPGQHTEPGQKYRVFPRADVVAGWGASHNTVYLIYPETMDVPTKSPNWDSG